MAKSKFAVLVMSADAEPVPVADDTLDNVLELIRSIRSPLQQLLGNDTDSDGKQTAGAKLQADNEKTKELRHELMWLNSAFSADRSGILGVGRAAKVTPDVLREVYLLVKREHPGMKETVVFQWTASTYNKKYAGTPTDEIDKNYVGTAVKRHAWDTLDPFAGIADSEVRNGTVE
jgi:hypothetical protein